MKLDSDPGPQDAKLNKLNKLNQVSAASSSNEADAASRILKQCLEREHATILQNLRVLAWSFHLASRSVDIEVIAHEMLSELTAEVLKNASKFDVTRRPLPWIIKFGSNVAKRHRTKTHRQNQHEQSFSALLSGHEQSDKTPPAEIFDLFADLRQDALVALGIDNDPEALALGDESRAEDLEVVRAIFERLSSEDREVLALWIIHDKKMPIVAEKLHTPVGTARQRQYRALNRARRILDEGATARRVLEDRKDQDLC